MLHATWNLKHPHWQTSSFSVAGVCGMSFLNWKRLIVAGTGRKAGAAGRIKAETFRFCIVSCTVSPACGSESCWKITSNGLTFYFLREKLAGFTLVQLVCQTSRVYPANRNTHEKPSFVECRSYRWIRVLSVTVILVKSIGSSGPFVSSHMTNGTGPDRAAISSPSNGPPENLA